jgi:hypothetical protein
MTEDDKFPKVVTSPHYHIWTDALHARALAHQAQNKWDRGTYVRWAITTSWTVLEMACEDALQKKGIGRSFKVNLDKAVAEFSLDEIDWGSGTWQQITELHKMRTSLVHINPSQAALFLEMVDADNAITSIREAIKDIYVRAGKVAPQWVGDDYDRGWDQEQGMSAHAMIIHAGADPDSPDVIKIGYVYKGREFICSVCPPHTDPESKLIDLIQSVRIPISGVRAYRGQTLIVDRVLQIRGT